MATKRPRPPAPSSPVPQQRGFLARAFRWTLISGGIIFFGLLCAIGFAFSSLPDFKELRTRESLGEVVRVRAQDGRVIFIGG